MLASGQLPEHVRERYARASAELVAQIEDAGIATCAHIRLHGDCHLGNLLWLESTGPHFVDFDDCLTGPAIQDLWMLLSGSANERSRQLQELLSGYTQFADIIF